MTICFKDPLVKCCECGSEFIRTGKNHKRCSECSLKRTKKIISDWQKKYRNKDPDASRGAKFEDKNPQYLHGRCVFRRWAKEKLKDLNFLCERCQTLIDIKERHSWAGHHKDHDPTNNVKENLEVLCKRCHQIEHECWRNWDGANKR